MPDSVRSLVTDDDPQIALLACSFCLPRVSGTERDKVAAAPLVDLLDGADWSLRAEVEEVLIRNYESCRSAIEKKINLAGEPAAASLRRIVSKGT